MTKRLNDYGSCGGRNQVLNQSLHPTRIIWIKVLRNVVVWVVVPSSGATLEDPDSSGLARRIGLMA